MSISPISFYTLLSFIILYHQCNIPVTCSTTLATDYLDDVVTISCGSTGNSTALDGRAWIGDTGSKAMSLQQSKGKSRSSIAVDRAFSADPVPYLTSRISLLEFHYIFHVHPGQKFIRLHFYPASYRGFEKYNDFFTVKAASFTLLADFSPSLSADAFGVKYLVKEFCLNVEEKGNLVILFSPTQSSNSMKLYAFVNGIEIISMPTGLYYTPDGDLGASIVGKHNQFVVDNSTALEMIRRLNVGGRNISSTEDFGMFRSWSGDAEYFQESRLIPVNDLVGIIKWSNMLAIKAPLKIFQTRWKARKAVRVKGVQNFTWKIPVDIGFAYLVRLHFSEFDLMGAKGSPRVFGILINNHIAEAKANIIEWNGGTAGIPVHRDYVVVIKGDKDNGKCDLLITLQSPNAFTVELLKGLEIFKLSNTDNNLASPRTVSSKGVSTFGIETLKLRKSLIYFGQSSTIATWMITLISLLSVMLYNLRIMWEKNFHGLKDTQAASNESSCRRFSLTEIKIATENFREEFVIGKGGFGKVYKGSLPGISEFVAIKRLNSISKQGGREFWTEIEILSKLRHKHIVSLIGYCNQSQEMILVYDYMQRGTIADNLYKIGRNTKDFIPLSWEQRLKICIGAARGLDYLHTGSERGVIHRDVKDTNILLDENLIAKISDFGMSKLENISQSNKSYISTKVKGTRGYLDLDYVLTHRLSRKTDVYAFGILLMVVLCGRPAVDSKVTGREQSLLLCFKECNSKGEIVDPNLQGKIWSGSLNVYVKCIENCLHPEPKRRPTMAQVVECLMHALEWQQSTMFPIPENELIGNVGIPTPGNQLDSLRNRGKQMKEKDLVLPDGPGNQLNPREKEYTSVQKPLGIRPGETLRDWGKPTKEKDLVLPDGPGNQLNPREKEYTSVQKPLGIRPRETLRDWGKPAKEKDLVLPDGPSCRFTYADILAATNNFRHDSVILQDEFRTVYVGFIKHMLREVSIHQLQLHARRGPPDDFCKSIEMISKLRHPNLLSLLGYCCHGGKMFVIFDHIGNSTLHGKLYDENRRQDKLPWKLRLSICIGIAQGLEYVHKGTGNSTVLVDIRPSIIFLDENWVPKISNLGLRRAVLEENFPCLTQVMRRAVLEENFSCETHVMRFYEENMYKSQDSIRLALHLPHCYHREIAELSDVHSFGMILFEVVCCRRPVNLKVKYEDAERFLQNLVRMSIKNKTLHKIIDSSLYGEIAPECLAEYLKIAFSCLVVPKSERPSMVGVIEKLNGALRLQEIAEEGKQKLHGKANYNFHLEDVYKELSNLAA